MISFLIEKRVLLKAFLLFGVLCFNAQGAAGKPQVETVSHHSTGNVPQTPFFFGSSIDATSQNEPRRVVSFIESVAPRTGPRAPRETNDAVNESPSSQQTTASKLPARIAPPHRLVSVVHRLRGWKLLSWLASSGPPTLELDELPTAFESRTNVVAGLLTPDGRTVVARLLHVEQEIEIPTSAPDALFKSSDEVEPSEFAVILSDGREVVAKFVGFDAVSGLSLLEIVEAVEASPAGDEGDTEEPTIGQRIQLFAPAPFSDAVSSSSAPRTLLEEGELMLRIEQTGGMLTDVSRTPAGGPFSFIAQTEDVSSAWAGAIATDGKGALVGIVSQIESGRTQIVPAATMRRAIERVKKERASVPQPWLGARGDAVFDLTAEKWVGTGWKPEQLTSLMRAHRGVLLTSVAPGTPAAVAGLKAGDIVERVGDRDVKGVEDLSFALIEHPVGATVDFTIRRAFESDPLRLQVRLMGTPNPALATAQAEMRAARAEFMTAHYELSTALDAQASLRNRPLNETKALRASFEARRLEAERRLSKAMRLLTEAEARMANARPTASSANNEAFTSRPASDAFRPLLAFGLRTIGLTRRASSRMGADGGHLVISVDRRSPAEEAGIRPGDVIERINGQSLTHHALLRLIRDAPSWAYVFDIVRGEERSRIEVRLADDKPSRR